MPFHMSCHVPYLSFVPAFTLTGSVSMQQCCFFVVCLFEGDLDCKTVVFFANAGDAVNIRMIMKGLEQV